MKKVIVVKGSQDGILGVFTNKKRAFECASAYVFGTYETELNMNYAKFCKKMSRNYCEVGEGYATASCEAFYLNDQ